LVAEVLHVDQVHFIADDSSLSLCPCQNPCTVMLLILEIQTKTRLGSWGIIYTFIWSKYASLYSF